MHVWGIECGTDSRKKKRERRTIFVRVRKGDHVFGENLWDAANAGGDNIETCTGGFEDGDTKGLGEGCVEEDRTTNEDLIRRRQHRKAATAIALEMGMRMESTACGGELTSRTSRCRTGPSSSIRSWRR